MISVKDKGESIVTVEYTNFTSILKTKILGQTKTCLVIKNTNTTKDITAKVYVSNDEYGSAESFVPYEIGESGTEDQAVIGEDSGKYVEIDFPYAWVDVQIQSEDADSPQASVWLLATH